MAIALVSCGFALGWSAHMVLVHFWAATDAKELLQYGRGVREGGMEPKSPPPRPPAA